jgi:hypothetical protein
MINDDLRLQYGKVGYYAELSISVRSRRPAPVDGIYSDGKDEAYSELYIYNTIKILTFFNPDYALDTFCDLQDLAFQPLRDFTMLLLNILMHSVQNRTNFSFR